MGSNMPVVLYKILFAMKKIYYNKLQRFFGFPVLKRKFFVQQGYTLDLNNPKSFNEKVNWKKVYDRNPLLPIVADKYRVRNYLHERLGSEIASEILIPHFAVVNNPSDIPFNELPDEYVIKTNHASGTNIIVSKDRPLDKVSALEKLNWWLIKPYGISKSEWVYQEIPPKIIIEKLLKDRQGRLPNDYKLHVFHGRCEFIQVDYDRFGGHEKSLYDREWEMLEVEWIRAKAKFEPPPATLERMISIAQILSYEFDYIRIDFYDVDGALYFGEMTHYPASGLGRFYPREFDFSLGKKWTIKPRYWEKGHG
ncbi:hypothetical protein Selin_0283 [Desulfurispirillum indicum S5]|uniref:Uncharacterized protein n=1 Tax=Desulfurispirillum indicum (strain ATCC BAA-1389 / DSM 22839 / S5) TaxID=653733 RepID=E6W6N9_DESIS|nr:ATP-grasp fold amidoligase family protein [Desulfurispirillum indicum]ADU65039.1 hypothetical protein Selin_0283 [Desulfurispirillum indicum S5]